MLSQSTSGLSKPRPACQSANVFGVVRPSFCRDKSSAGGSGVKVAWAARSRGRVANTATASNFVGGGKARLCFSLEHWKQEADLWQLNALKF